MSWLYSQALVAEYLGASCSDGEPSVQLSGNPTQQAYCAPDKMTDFSRLSRFGMTYKPLTENLGAAVLMWCQEDSRARTSALREKAQELTESDQVCGEKWQGSFAKYDPDTHSLRTHQCSLLEDLTESCQTLPAWGLMQDGECWEQPTLALRIRGTESGLWPTPTAHNAKETNAPSEAKRNEPTLASRVGGALNPTWVEWLMGWPLEWTDLKPLEMDKFQQWQQQHGNY